MEGEVGDNGPLRVGRFTPDENFAIVRGGCEDGAVFGVCLLMKEVNMNRGLGRREEANGPMRRTRLPLRV